MMTTLIMVWVLLLMKLMKLMLMMRTTVTFVVVKRTLHCTEKFYDVAMMLSSFNDEIGWRNRFAECLLLMAKY